MRNKLRDFGDLLRSDLFKLFKLKSVYIAAAVMFFMILIQYLVLWSRNIYFEDASITEGQIFFTPKGMLFGATSYISIGLFIGIICGIFIAGDFSHGTVRLCVARGARRTSVFFSKWAGITILTIGYCIFAILVCGIFTAASGGYGLPAFDGGEFALLLRSFTLQILVAVAMSSICVFVAFLMRSPGSTIGLTLGLFIIAGIFISVIVVLAAVTGNADLVYALEVLPSFQLETATSYNPYTVSQALRVTLIPLAHIVWTTGLGVFLFNSRDIK